MSKANCFVSSFTTTSYSSTSSCSKASTSMCARVHFYTTMPMCVYLCKYMVHKCPLSTTINKSLFVRNILEVVDLSMGLAVP